MLTDGSVARLVEKKSENQKEANTMAGERGN